MREILAGIHAARYAATAPKADKTKGPNNDPTKNTELVFNYRCYLLATMRAGYGDRIHSQHCSRKGWLWLLMHNNNLEQYFQLDYKQLQRKYNYSTNLTLLQVKIS